MTLLLALLFTLLLLRIAAVLFGAVAAVAITAVGCAAELLGWVLQAAWWAARCVLPHIGRGFAMAGRARASRTRAVCLDAQSALVRGTAIALAGRPDGR